MKSMLCLLFVMLMIVPGAAHGQIPEEQPCQLLSQPDEIRPQLDRIESAADGLASEVDEIRAVLQQVREDVERPSLVRKIGEDFFSNALWALLTSSENEGNRIRWLASLSGLVLVLAKILFFLFARGRERDAVQLGGAALNFGLWFYVIIVVAFLLPLAISRGIQIDASDANLASIERNLSQVSAQLGTLTADVERAVVSALDDQSSTAEVTERAPLQEAADPGIRVQLDALENGLTQTRSGMATDGFQMLNTVMVLIAMLLSFGIAGLLVALNLDKIQNWIDN